MVQSGPRPPSVAVDRLAGAFSATRVLASICSWWGEGEGGPYPDHLGTNFGDGLILGQGNVRKHGRVADDVGKCVAVDVGLELPARRVGVAGTDVLGLEALEFLLRAQLVGLGGLSERITDSMDGGDAPF